MPPSSGPRRRGSRAPSASSGRTGAWRRRAATSFVPRPLVDEAIDAVLEEGAVGRVLARLGLRDGPDVDLVYRLAPVPAARLANRLDRRFAEPWRDARVVVGDDAVRVVEARSGTGVDRGALRRALRTLPSRVELRIVPVRPVVSTAEAEAAAARVERLLDGPRRVRFGDAESTLTPRRLRALTRTERERRDARAWRSTRRVSRRRSGCASAGSRSPPATPPSPSAEQGVRVVPSRPGRVLDVERIGRSLVSNLESTTHLARFAKTATSAHDGGGREAGHPGADLGVHDLLLVLPAARHQHPAGGAAPRRHDRPAGGGVLAERRARQAHGRERLRRGAADLRRAARGCGRRRDQPGRDDALQRRLLRGRQARRPPGAPVLHLPLPDGTRGDGVVGRPGADLPERLAGGDPDQGRRERLARSPCASTRGSSGVVSRRRRASRTHRPRPGRSPTRNASLPPGTTSTVQSAGASGFTVQYTRKVFKGAQLVKNERYTVRYDPQNAIVELGPPKKAEARSAAEAGEARAGLRRTARRPHRPSSRPTPPRRAQADRRQRRSSISASEAS